MSISIFTSLLIISMLFIPEPSIYGFMELMVIPFSARCYTLFIIIVNAIVSILAELHLWRWLTNQFKKKRNLN